MYSLFSDSQEFNELSEIIRIMDTGYKRSFFLDHCRMARQNRKLYQIRETIPVKYSQHLHKLKMDNTFITKSKKKQNLANYDLVTSISGPLSHWISVVWHKIV